MFWLVDAYFAAAGKGECSELAPTLFADIRDVHLLRFEFFQGRPDVIAHQEELVLVVLLGIIERGLRVAASAKINQPWPASTEGNLSIVSKEGSIRFRLLDINDNMRTVDHGRPPISDL